MKPPVILLHGLGHSSLSMRKIENAIRRTGRKTFNPGYASGSANVDELAKTIWQRILDRYGETQQLDFITHSLGSIILRQIACTHPERIHRGVMLAPPNQGSELVDRFKHFALASWIMGPAGIELGTASDSCPNRLGPVEFCVGVIAGSKPDNPLARFFIPGQHDGRVSVESTRLTGMTDHLVMPHGHFYIMFVNSVIHQAIHFLDHGRFLRQQNEKSLS